MFSKIVLALWSALGVFWWLTAWCLVARDKPGCERGPAARRSLSVFKPLPPLGANGLDKVAAGLESFVAQLDLESELLLGIHDADESATKWFIHQLRTDYPEARLKVIFRSQPDDMANPKIAWQRILSLHAEGELWLWSDADIIAPAHFLESARLEYARQGAPMLTFPYVIREIPLPSALLEALYVNVDFFPGVLLLRQCGPVDFGLGAGMLFQRDDFERRVDWSDLGAVLADDFLLGQTLGPVRLGRTRLTTVASSATWKEAFLHDMRWTKTIRWSRPGGSFARILVIPVLGWLGYVIWHPFHLSAWVGLLAMVQTDVLFAFIICRSAGCPLDLRNLAGLEIWSFWRTLLWAFCWLPWPVLWSGKTWRGPQVPITSPVIRT